MKLLSKRSGVALATLAVAATLGLTACTSDADVASKNLSKEADQFKILRRVVFYNGITGDYILEVEGYCSVDPGDSNRMSITCKVGDRYVKNFLGKSDNVTWFAEQIQGASVSTKHYKVVFKPSTILPQPEIR
jgi:hypothetical protein